MSFSNPELNEEYEKFSKWVDELPKIKDEYIGLLRLKDKYYNDENIDKATNAYLNAHRGLKYIIDDHKTWMEILKFSVSYLIKWNFYVRFRKGTAE